MRYLFFVCVAILCCSIASAADELMTFSVDGSPLVTLESYQQNDTAGQYIMYWGDNFDEAGGTVHSSMEWYGVGFNAVPSTIPEPAVWIMAAAVLGCGLIVYGWRRSR